ncbi:MAG: tryptophan-rich sensory protein [candidate division WS1 bacterium]|nr:tryptophan-rich sensory protein [candidate division WS1 bacterium]
MKIGDIVRLVVSIIVCYLPALGGLSMESGEGSWYQQLTKPALNPPGWLFGPVWTALYLMMGIALYLVWSRAGRPGVSLAIGVFAVQLLLNGLWTPAFFGMQSPATGLMVIIPMWFGILASIILFWRISVTAGALLIPYLAWVSFATYLNSAIWWLNR